MDKNLVTTHIGKYWVTTPLESPPVGISSSQQVVLARFLTAADKAAALLVAALLYCTVLLYTLYTSTDGYTTVLHCNAVHAADACTAALYCIGSRAL